MIVRGTMDAGINNVIYMELNSEPKMANSTCGKTTVAGTIDRGFTVYVCVCVCVCVYIYIYIYIYVKRNGVHGGDVNISSYYGF
jgi:hypothetical protein